MEVSHKLLWRASARSPQLFNSLLAGVVEILNGGLVMEVLEQRLPLHRLHCALEVEEPASEKTESAIAVDAFLDVLKKC